MRQARGPRRVAEQYLARLLDEADTPGLRRGIDPATGALVFDRAGGGARERRPLPGTPEAPSAAVAA